MVAEQAEQKTRQDFDADKSEAEALNNKTIEYQMVRQEADQTRSLYDDMLRHLKESGLLAGLRSTNISIVDWAKPSDAPAKPVILLYLLGSIVAGLIFGVVAALLRDVTDTKIQDLREISRELGPMPLCVLPYQKEQRFARRGRKLDGEICVACPGQPALPVCRVASLAADFSDAVAQRSASAFGAGDQSPGGRRERVFSAGTWPSSLPSRASECCCAMPNLRRPWLHRNLEVSPTVGLSTVLAGLSPDHGASVVIPVHEVPGLFLLPAGPLPPYPAELLASRIRWRSW